MQPIPSNPGMRVRCVDEGGNVLIHKGGEYRVAKVEQFGMALQVEGNPIWYRSERFKPIIRVKMNSARPLGPHLTQRISHDLRGRSIWVERLDGSNIFSAAHGQ